MDMTRPVVLSIAGLDPSGGAGIVADIKTIAALDCFPAAALTSITFQNTTGVFGAEHPSAATLRAQVEPIVQDLNVAAAKTGGGMICVPSPCTRRTSTRQITPAVVRQFTRESEPRHA